MDDKKVQVLLEQAGREYSEGRYDQAIATWQAVLQEDAENQQAREGIRMARMLVQGHAGDEGEVAELSVEPDAADPDLQQKIELGIARIRELLSGGRYQEAMEGCQLLAELAPGMESVRSLQEEVSHAFEAQPFIAECLGRARKLMAQGRPGEALEEARKILSIDKENPEATALAAQLSEEAGPAAGPKAPSAFDRGPAGAPAAPSPFAGRKEPDEASAGAEFDDEYETGPRRAVSADQTPPPEAAGGEGGLEMEFEEFGGGPEEGTPAAMSEGSAEIRGLLEKGRELFALGKFQDAIDAWSHVYAIDSGHAAAGELIDQAKARMAEVARQADEAYYRGVDLFEAGNLEEARNYFKEVLALQPDHADALSYVEQITAKAGGEALESIPLVEPLPDAAVPPGGEAQPDEELAAAAAPAPALDREALEPPPSPAPAPPAEPIHVTAGPVKKMRRPPEPPSRSGSRLLILVAALVVVFGGAAAAWMFIPWGSQPEVAPEPPDQASEEPAEPLPETLPPGAGDGSGEEEAPPPVEGSLDVVPGTASPPAQPKPMSPREIERQVSSLMRQGRSLMSQGKFAEAKAKFEEALALDPGNFDADDLRIQASERAAAEAKFNRDLTAGKDAFASGDWAGALYKFYRLREQRRDMTILSRYIKNANYNWGIESLEAFDIAGAVTHFKDAQEMAPANREIERALAFAQRYERRRRDSAYDSFVSRLPPKALDQQ